MNFRTLLKLNALPLGIAMTVSLQLYAEPAFPTKNERCVSCHGALGVSNYTYFPNIAGQKRTYLSNQLKAFRDGTRSDPWMTPMARDLSDKEIDALAEFYSNLQ